MTVKPPNPVDHHVGSRVRMRRMMLGMSQEKLATGLGLTFQQIHKYETGTVRIGSGRLMQIAGILQVPPDFFFEDVPGQPKIGDNAPSPAFVSDFLATSDGLALARAFNRLPNAKLRRSIVAMVEGVADNQ
jgi:transcriptional regulator with XRE-family HTH domain